ncbi:unnamed protein product [Onchocerca flexuosa]|uniref:Cyclin N-terminal domain-containing protein n=1 Tax=Onchocerca flexuosa TaxID=387005 RepID=A0A183I505_9BILA|nr:unnamed protein product [Onchocerca flexuosa]
MSAASVTTNISTSQAAASDERQSAAAASVSASVPSSSRWIFTHEQLMRITIQSLDLKSQLTYIIIHLSQLCICAAMMHMHRFFVFHSFFKFDPRDIAAACLFLAGKSEECPRKLDHVVRVWWAIKFPHSPNLDNNRLHDASQLIVTLENLVLQTIGNTAVFLNCTFTHAAFDLSVDIPHPYVLTHMQKFARDASGNRRISEIAYWFASDIAAVLLFAAEKRSDFISSYGITARVEKQTDFSSRYLSFLSFKDYFAFLRLHMTNWGVRYTAKAIACVCIQMACLWAEFEVSDAKISNLFFLWYSIRTDEEDCNRSQKEVLLILFVD